MAIPAGVYRVVLSGSLPGGEIWSMGFWVAGGLPTDQDSANVLAQLWVTQLNATVDPAPMRLLSQNFWTPATTWDKCTVYIYAAGGPHASLIGEADVAVVGAESGHAMPNQVCMVVSLRTGAPGRRARGRFYQPVTGIQVNTDGQFATTYTNALATSWATFFSDWNASGDNGVVAVVSSAGTSHRTVTQVVIDTRPDVQRRRAISQAIDARSTEPVTV